MKKSGWTLVELMIVCAIVAIVATLGLGGGCNVSHGQRVGIVTKYANKGIFNKSNEGELLMGGMRSSADGRGMVANVFRFSVLNPTVSAKVQAACDSQKPVALVYDQSYGFNPLRQNTAYVVVEVKEVQ